MNKIIATIEQITSVIGVAKTMPFTFIKVERINISGISKIPFLNSAKIVDLTGFPTAWKKEMTE